MTRYGWDASNHDWTRGPMNLAQARADGIDLFTHKSSEGWTYEDPYFAEAMNRAHAAAFPVIGAYHVLWPNNPTEQADFWLTVVNNRAAWWKQYPCWIFQIDAELFQEFTPYRQPTVAEINACGDRIVSQSGCRPYQVVVYAPEWLYGDGLTGLKYRTLWSSNYASGSGGFKQLYPGDGSGRWRPYSGIEPTILQYTSTATIAGQSPADANAVRVATESDLQALFLEGESPVTEAEIAAIVAGVHDMLLRGSVLSDVGTLRTIVETQYKATTAKLTTLTAALGDAKTAILAALDAESGDILDGVKSIVAAGGDPEKVAEAIVAYILSKLGAGSPA